MNPIVRRVVAALLTAGAVVAALLYVPFSVALPILIGVVMLVQFEFYQMISKKYETIAWLGLLMGLTILVGTFYGRAFKWMNGAAAVLSIGGFFLSWLVALFGRYKKPIVALGSTWLGVFYIPVMLTFFAMIPQKYGMMMLLYVIAIVKVSDMGGFALGMLCGKHKMCPSISPKKSWEGLFGSVLASVILSVLFMPLTHFALCKALAFGASAAVLGTLGDLVESRFKRECEVKDSATFMPAGLGGFLDMFDSLIFAPAILLYFI